MEITTFVLAMLLSGPAQIGVAPIPPASCDEDLDLGPARVRHAKIKAFLLKEKQELYAQGMDELLAVLETYEQERATICERLGVSQQKVRELSELVKSEILATRAAQEAEQLYHDRYDQCLKALGDAQRLTRWGGTLGAGAGACWNEDGADPAITLGYTWGWRLRKSSR